MTTSLPQYVARAVLYLLVFIHVVLPFTPVNPHPELHIKAAGVLIGALFAGLAFRSHRHPFSAFLAAGVALSLVIALSAATDRSPIQEGWAVKLLLVSGLTWGAFASSREALGRS